MTWTIDGLAADAGPAMIWREIEIPGHGTFKIGLQRPTTGDRAVNQDLIAFGGGSPTMHRLATCVKGWRDLNQRARRTDIAESTPENPVWTEIPIPFSPENFDALCSQFPAVFTVVAAEVSRLWRGVEPAELGNSQAPSGRSGTAPPQTNEPSGSSAGSTNAAPSGSAGNS